MRAWIALLIIAVALAAGLFLLPNSRAHAAPGGPVLELAQAAPAVGPGFVDSFAVACTTSATAITAAPHNMLSYTCQNSSTTKVAVGDSGITDPTDAQNAPIYCATNCPAQEFGGNAKIEYCRADTGSVTIYCRALIAASSAP
jgi:hypothetical protein